MIDTTLKALKGLIDLIESNPDEFPIDFICCCDGGDDSVGLAPAICEYHYAKYAIDLAEGRKTSNEVGCVDIGDW